MADPYDLDPDVAVLRRKANVSAIPTKKSPFAGKNPQLQPDAEYDYESDPDVAILTNRVAKDAEQKTETGFFPSWLRTGLETGLGVASGIATPIAGGIYGIAKSIPEAIKTGQAPAPIAQRYAEQFIKQRPGFTVTDPQAQANLEAVQQAFEASKLPPVFPEAQGLGVKPAEVLTNKIPLKTAANAQDALTQQFAQKVTQGTQAAKDLVSSNKVSMRVEPTGQSAGAAAAVPENVLRGNIDAAIANASPDLQAHISQVPPQKVNVPALETRALEEKHGVNLLTSQRTGDLQGYTEAWNQRAKNGLVSDFEQQPKQLANAFEMSKQRHAPDIPSTADASELGQITINSLAEKDKVRQQAISNAYKALEDANGGQFPIDTGKLKQNIDAELTRKYKSRYLSEGIAGDLNQFLENPTFEGFEALRTNLADEMRSAKDGKTRQAAYIVRDELEKLPIFGEGTGDPRAIQLKELADNARQLHAQRKRIIENNPAYKAAIKESANLDDVVAQGESLNADKFHQKFIANASPEAIRRMKAEIGSDNLANQAIAFAELERAKRAITNANETRVKSDTFADFLRKNKSVLKESLPPEAMQDVMEIGLLNSKIGKPEAGAFNYSNTWSSMMADMAKQGLLGLGEAKLAAATSGASIPAVGGMKMMFEKMNKDAFANSQRNPYGGLTKD